MSDQVNKLFFLNCDTIGGRHNEPDAYGKCNWCGRKIANKRDRPRAPIGYVNNLDEAYEMMYDPDYNA